MRRLPVLATALITLLPVTLLTTTGSASAATATLTVTTYDRTGAKLKAPLRLINLDSGAQYTATSLKAKKLPKGKYAVLTDIYSAKDGTDTLGARVLKVSGKTATTIDARRGRAIKVALDKIPDGQPYQELRAQICANSSSSSTEIGAWNTPGKMFVIPNGSKSLRFAYNSAWSNSTTNSVWLVSAATKTVPAGVTRTWRTSSLATVRAVAKRGPAGSDQSDLRLEETSSCHAGYGVQAFSGRTPAVATFHVSPGKWQLSANWWGTESTGNSAMMGFDNRNLTVVAGRSYGRSFFNAGWGPGRSLPRLYSNPARLRFDTSRMFTDPAYDLYSEASQRSKVTLYDSARKVVKSQWRTDWEGRGSDFSAKIKTKGWYTLQVDAQRYRPGIKHPADMLSPRVQAIFRMKVDPKAKPRSADLILPRMVPTGLDMNNRARPGSSTVLEIRPDVRRKEVDLKLGKVTAKTVTTQVSFDGGKTWRSLTVRKSGTKWLATIKNPASGAVALRTRITTTKNAYAQVTIVRAYTVG
ncbi:hypothetical protein OHA21_16425 [Actinoplanes sp. NBC_00393]|uniref:hypothetical protein n=1 Tax=Actinoplanes sp. NBC_00393 TaxID=2975953 RepID=UPI002E1B3ED7